MNPYFRFRCHRCEHTMRFRGISGSEIQVGDLCRAPWVVEVTLPQCTPIYHILHTSNVDVTISMVTLTLTILMVKASSGDRL